MSELLALRVFLVVGELFAASALVMALAWLASFRSTASLRHLIWSAAFGALLLLPALAALLPGRFVLTLPTRIIPAGIPTGPIDVSVLATTAPQPQSFQIGMPQIAWALIALWLGGIALIVLRSVVASVVLWIMRRNSVDNPFDPSELPELASGRRYELRVSRGEHGPVTWGVFRPVVLLPNKALYWPGERLHAALLHELAHVHRRDSLTQMLSFIACALYWPNPFVWLGARALRREAEMAADDAVLVSGMAPSTYAGELLHIAAEFRARGLSPMPLFMAAPSSLASRLQSVLTPTRHRSGVTSMDVLKMTAVALLATSALVAARPSLAQDEPPVPPAPAAEMAAPPAEMPTPPAPPALPAVADMPTPPTPPSAVVNVDPNVRVIRIENMRHGKKHSRVEFISNDDRVVEDTMANVRPEIDRAIAEVKAHQTEIRRIQEMRPQIDAEIRKAMAEARAQLAQINDVKIRARVDEALARAQAKIERAHLNEMRREERTTDSNDDSESGVDTDSK
ncbi:MAG TPA: M56 family metallopeptidase [Rhizomicrobium sp.]|jgi:beta-lactamase regulating signal transducer with metallopeptidase domain